jgi:hypothetical protein
MRTIKIKLACPLKLSKLLIKAGKPGNTAGFTRITLKSPKRNKIPDST